MTYSDIVGKITTIVKLKNVKKYTIYFNNIKNNKILVILDNNEVRINLDNLDNIQVTQFPAEIIINDIVDNDNKTMLSYTCGSKIEYQLNRLGNLEKIILTSFNIKTICDKCGKINNYQYYRDYYQKGDCTKYCCSEKYKDIIYQHDRLMICH